MGESWGCRFPIAAALCQRKGCALGTSSPGPEGGSHCGQDPLTTVNGYPSQSRDLLWPSVAAAQLTGKPELAPWRCSGCAPSLVFMSIQLWRGVPLGKFSPCMGFCLAILTRVKPRSRALERCQRARSCCHTEYERKGTGVRRVIARAADAVVNATVGRFFTGYGTGTGTSSAEAVLCRRCLLQQGSIASSDCNSGPGVSSSQR
ncbi:hypothetical protein F5884DRAFT_194585 [Xylogone sp. PMI_703]|nr:hypothetical protein F5884DRAFT_194585 [Xylogone sp. PMI_703]